MQWTPGGESSDIEDRRDEGGGGGGGGFGLGPIHLGIGGTLIVGLLSLIFHQNLFSLFSGGPATAPQSQVEAPGQTGQNAVGQDASEQREVQLVSFVVDDVQQTWTTLLPQQANRPYRHAHLVLYRNETNSGCGDAQASTGPFYCPEDEKVYLDLGFFQELSQRFGAPGDFAKSYVVAHEFGHHVQKILGIESQVRRLQQSNPGAVNALSVKVELQADCFAGVWGHTTEQRNIINQSDVAAGLQAAASVGDDRLQRMARGTVSPETFTHGTSAQRMHWFQAGLQSGRIADCNTFGAQ